MDFLSTWYAVVLDVTSEAPIFRVATPTKVTFKDLMLNGDFIADGILLSGSDEVHKLQYNLIYVGGRSRVCGTTYVYTGRNLL